MRWVYICLLGLTLLIALEECRVIALPGPIPLIIKSPYLHSWIDPNDMISNNSIASPFTWNRMPLQWTSKILVDNTTTYEWMGGNPNSTHRPNLTTSIITPTRTIFTFQAGSVGFNATFLSPIDPSDLVRQSLPFGYVYVDIWSLDGNPHSIEIYFDTTGDILSIADLDVVANTTFTGDMVYHRVTLSNPEPFVEDEVQLAKDSTFYLAMENKPNTTWEIGSPGIGNSTAQLSDSDDTPKFGAVTGSTHVILAFKTDLGRITQTNESVIWTMGLVRDPAIQDTSFGSTQLRRSYYWSAYDSVEDIIQDVIGKFDDVMSKSINLDNRIMNDGYAIPSNYDYLLSISLRLTFGAMDITIGSFPNGTMDSSDVQIFVKDIGTSNRVSPVEILYASLPALLYLNSSLAGLMLEPLLKYQNSSNYTNAYAAPDLGLMYPNVTGNPSFNKQLAVESCGSMLIMTFAHASKSGDGTLLNRYYDLLQQWAQYLEQSGLQSTTDGFETFDGDTGQYLSNLALKGIVGIYAMSRISDSAGRSVDSSKHLSLARNYTSQWKQIAISFGHITESVTGNATTSTGGLPYNLYAARLLSATTLIDDAVYTQQSQFYLSQLASQPVFSYDVNGQAKSHWTMFAAAVMPDPTVRNALIAMVSDNMFNAENEPFPSTFDPSTGAVISGVASPAQGAMFALLALNLTDRHIAGFSPVTPASPARRSAKEVGAIVGGTIAAVFSLCIFLLLVLILRKRGSYLFKRHHNTSHERTVISPFQVPRTSSSILINWARTLPIMSKSSSKTDISYTQPPEGNTPTVERSELASSSGPNIDILMVVERLRREMDEMRNERIQETEPPPLYDFQNQSSAEDHAVVPPSA